MRCRRAVDGPFGRQHCLLAAHPQVARLVRLAHEVADGVLLGQLEVEVCLHATAVHVCRHGVPHRAGLEFGHAHLQLARGQHLVDNHLVDDTVVRPFERAHLHADGVRPGNLAVRAGAVCRGGVEVELRRTAGVAALEGYLAVASSQVERLLVVQLEHGVARAHDARSADVEDAHLAPCGEEGSLQRVDSLQAEHLAHRLCAADDHAVVHGIDHIDFVGCEYSFDEEVAPYARRVVMLRVLGMRRIAYFIVRFHTLFIYSY